MSAPSSARVAERTEASAVESRLAATPPAWHSWVTATGNWAPGLSPDGRRVVFVSDRSGLPRAWVAPVNDTAGAARLLPTGRDHVEAVAWSPGGEWIAVLGAPGGEAT